MIEDKLQYFAMHLKLVDSLAILINTLTLKHRVFHTMTF